MYRLRDVHSPGGGGGQNSFSKALRAVEVNSACEGIGNTERM